MIELTNEQMIELWKSNKTLDDIGRELGVDRKIILNAFRRLRDQGYVEGQRPRSLQSYARNDDARHYGVFDDGTMLERLRQEHPERDPDRKTDDAQGTDPSADHRADT